jgi:ryanodine receptor 2
MAYQPKPIDTSHVTLPVSLAELLEKLAKNTHEVWAAQRIKDGWTFGPNRDDAKKKHPCLVPYEQLPESEKEYDRQTAGQALKAVISLGYTVEESRAESR